MQHLDLELAHRFLQDRLAPDEHRHWEQHLQGCERCRELVASERALLAVLDLDALPPVAEAAPRLPAAVAAAAERDPRAAGRGRRAAVVVLTELIVALGLLALLAWQGVPRRDPAATLAQELRISPDAQQRLLTNLPALLALERDPWLAEEGETVTTLAELIREFPP